jgi:hypothetical protein
LLQVTIQLEYLDLATATAVANAVAPDNTEVPAGLTVQTRQEGNIVATEISLDGKLATFIATIDDLLEAASTAEKTLRIIKANNA